MRMHDPMDLAEQVDGLRRNVCLYPGLMRCNCAGRRLHCVGDSVSASATLLLPLQRSRSSPNTLFSGTLRGCSDHCDGHRADFVAAIVPGMIGAVLHDHVPSLKEALLATLEFKSHLSLDHVGDINGVGLMHSCSHHPHAPAQP